MENISGVYRIVNTSNGKFYLGSTIDFERRWNEHRCGLRANKHINIRLQNSWNKHGERCFDFEVLKQCDPKNILQEEQHYLNELNPWKQSVGYNIGRSALGGDNLTNHPDRLNIVKKLSSWSKSMWARRTPEEREEFSKNRSGDKNPNWKGGVSKKNCEGCGKEIFPYHRFCSKCSKIGNRNPFFGKTHSTETLEKMGNKRKLNPHKLPNNSKYIFAEGTVYPSANKAAIALNISRGLINHRIKKRPDAYYWITKPLPE